MKPYFYDVNELLTKNEEGKTIINKEKLEELFDKIYLEGYFCGLEEYPCKDCDNKKQNDYSSQHFSHPEEDREFLHLASEALEENDWEKAIDDLKDRIKDKNNREYSKKLFFDKLNSDGYITSLDFEFHPLFSNEGEDNFIKDYLQSDDYKNLCRELFKEDCKKERKNDPNINFKGYPIPEEIEIDQEVFDSISNYIAKILGVDYDEELDTDILNILFGEEDEDHCTLKPRKLKEGDDVDYDDLQAIGLEELEKCIKLDRERKYQRPEKEDKKKKDNEEIINLLKDIQKRLLDD